MIKIHSPHDKFFRETWSRKEVVTAFLQDHIPKAVSQALNLETLYLEKDTFIDTELNAHYSDLLYSLEVQGSQPVQLYLLFEHKSHPEQNIHLQLLRYMVKIQEAEYKQNKQLVPVIPLVLYHGKAGWEPKQAFQDLFELPSDLKPYALNFQLIFCNLSALNDNEITDEVFARVAMMTLKYIFEPELSEKLPEILLLLKTLAAKETMLEYLEVVLKYVSSASQVEKGELQQAIEVALPQLGGSTMATLAEKWMSEGRQEGKQEGIQQGEINKAREDVIEVLIIKFSEVPESIVSAVNEVVDPARLKEMHREAVRTESLEAFEKWMSK
jgi:predicted transposase/invertase (TIGR01784 family)